MKTKLTLSLLLLSAAFATPTLANYFHNPSTNLNWNIGSAPSPTPLDIRENRQPRVTKVSPSDDNFVADDTMKNADKSAANDHPVTRNEGGKNLSTALLSR
jgi:hypothetical protein